MNFNENISEKQCFSEALKRKIELSVHNVCIKLCNE